ncbi:bifunctional metallophosphatase/5'-nucleotidase [Thermodesulfobacteriota bacterium]
MKRTILILFAIIGLIFGTVPICSAVNQPPDCTSAYPSIDSIWPPNHKFVDVDILGVTDPDGDPITITIISIFQDESVDTSGDGSFSPDGAGIGTDTASIRAERDGSGNGRIYHIEFMATDDMGGVCVNFVSVGVPLNKQDDPIDDGASYDSSNGKPKVHFSLTILHNNDGESQLINLGSGLEDFGGVARFKTVVDNLKWEATHWPRSPGQHGTNRGVIMVSSGDNILAGPEFNASIDKGIPFYDTIAMDQIGYDAVNIGNHDFDFGPDVLADFIEGYERTFPAYLSANLDYSGEPRLQALFNAGRIARSIVVKERGENIGIIGVITPDLLLISSPRNISVSSDVAEAVQDEVDRLKQMRINKIILISHMRDIASDIALVAQLTDIDVMVAGGSDELLANPGDLLIPGDEGDIFGPYPMIGVDMDGKTVPVVTTAGQYSYVGNLVVDFDKDGNVIDIGENSRPVRVATGSCNGKIPCDDAVDPDPTLQSLVVYPVAAYVDSLDTNVIAISEVDLDGLRSSVRSGETNEGNLIADALLWQATQLATSFGVSAPDVALQNGGGIRNDSIIPVGNITVLDTFSMVPFPNFVTILENIPRSQFKEILENAVSRTQPGDIPGGTGRYAQISGFSFTWSELGTAQVLNPDGTVATPGTRVQTVVLDGGSAIVSGGAVVPGNDLTIATVDFLARGGDQYPFRGAPFTIVGVAYQQALVNYIEDVLEGTISAADYPEGGEGRITELP